LEKVEENSSGEEQWDINFRYLVVRLYLSYLFWSKSRGAEMKLPPGAGAEIKNCGSGSFLRIFFGKKHGS
jgi:hypothetical protein